MNYISIHLGLQDDFLITKDDIIECDVAELASLLVNYPKQFAMIMKYGKSFNDTPKVEKRRPYSDCCNCATPVSKNWHQILYHGLTDFICDTCAKSGNLSWCKLVK